MLKTLCGEAVVFHTLTDIGFQMSKGLIQKEVDFGNITLLRNFYRLFDRRELVWVVYDVAMKHSKIFDTIDLSSTLLFSSSHKA